MTRTGITLLFFLFNITLLVSGQNNRKYFYTGKGYGSEALFNPLTLLFNGGYDVTQLQQVSHSVKGHPYGKMFRVVMKNLGDPFTAVNNYGWGNFLRGEILPLSFEKGNMQWIPNYQQHLIGGGMLFTAMKEWYEYRNIPFPGIMSGITVMAQHIFNEVMESGANEQWSVDEVSDIYLFDLGGILLFSFDSVNEFFADELNLADWSLQATVTLPDGSVNAGQYFSIKWKFPFSEDYSLFYRYGMGALFGVSKKLTSGESISAGIGFKTKHLIDLSDEFRKRTIETSWHAGIFYDRNNSLLASIVLSGVKEYFIMADVYPGVLKVGSFSPGFWTIIGRDGKILFGITTEYLLGGGVEIK